MEHLGFIFFLLLIVSVTVTTFEPPISANNPNGEVKNKELTNISTFYILQSLFATLVGVSLDISMALLVRFTP